MKKIFTLLILLTTVFTNAQTIIPEIEWEKSLGSQSNDGAGGITVTADGGYIVFGDIFDLSGNVTTHYGYSDYWIAKLDALGTLEWEKTYGGTSFEGSAASGLKVDTAKIRQTPDGGYILGANSSSNDIDVSANFGESDVWLVKIDNIGTIEWEKNYGNEYEDAFFDIRVTNDGGFIMTNGTSDPNTYIYGSKITKLDAQGNVEWTNSYEGTGQFMYSHLLNIVQTSDGGYIATGWTTAENSETTPQNEIFPGFYDPNGRLWVLKINASGVFQWAKTYGGTNLEEGYSIVETAEGNFVVAGMTYSGDGDVVGHPDPDNAPAPWVLKLDNLGEVLWQNTYGLRGSVNDIKIMPDGNYVIGGSYIVNIESTNGQVITGRGSTDEFLMKLNPVNGDIIWTKTMGGSLNDNLWGFALTPEGGFITVGSSWSVDGDISANIGGFDYWVVKLAPDCVVPVLTVDTTSTTCLGQEVTLSAVSDGNTINWYSSETATNILFTGPNFVTPALTEGTSYWVGAVSPTGCISKRTEVVVTVTALPVLTVDTTTFTICENTTALLTASTTTGNLVVWYDSENATQEIASGTEFTTPELRQNTSYWVQAYNPETHCVSERTKITITVTPAPLAVVEFSYINSVCILGNNPAPIIVNGFVWGGTFSASSGLSIDPLTGEIDLSLSSVGTYTVKYTVVTSGCLLGNSDSAVIIITDLATPMISFNYVEICTKDINAYPVLNNGFVNGGTFSSTSDLPIDASTGEIDVRNSKPGKYVVVYQVEEDHNSCLAAGKFESEVIIKVCMIQKGISPNGDGLNDWFDLTGIGVRHLGIFNRYGREVYSQSNYIKEWGGLDRDNKELPDGTYYYAIEKIDGDKLTGWIYINRNH